MTSTARAGNRIVGSLLVVGGTGVVRMEDRYDAGVDDLWSALTDPDRLARWVAELKGDLRPGGTFYARFTSGWESPGRIDVCDRPRRLLLTMRPGEPDQRVIEARLTPEGGQTLLVIEDRGLPPDELATHGAGWQAHLEDLVAHLAGRGPADWRSRWVELIPPYEDLAGNPRWEAERASLTAFLDAQRRSVLAIIEGLGEDHLRHAAAPSGWTPLGVIEHLAYAERFWFQRILTGEADPLPWPDDDDDTAHTTREVLEFYRSQCAASDKALARTALTAVPLVKIPGGLPITDDIHTARDIVLHMIEETAHHAGQLDLARELTDGRTGLGLR